jgi:Ca-activated chloride channel homolog
MLEMMIMRTKITSILIFVLVIVAACSADKTYAQNRKAAQLYQNGNYDDALKIYDDAVLENPNELKLKMNRGSTLFRLKQFDKAEEAYKSAEGLKDKKALADLYYNRGNTLFREGQQMMSSGGKEAGDKFKGALENYIKSLDLKPSDKDAKWNVQLTQAVLKQLQNQQQNQNNQDKNNKDKQDKDQQKQDKQNQDKQDQQKNQDQNKQDQQKQQDQKDKQDQQKKDEQNKEDQQNQDQKQAQSQPQPDKKEEDRKKEEAKRLIIQFSDDAKDLNKPIKLKASGEKKPDKDW